VEAEFRVGRSGRASFFLFAKLGFGLTSSSGFVAVFWPMGFGVGVQ
jgi:hypothetical protein